jgi:hypothetical protein
MSLLELPPEIWTQFLRVRDHAPADVALAG